MGQLGTGALEGPAEPVVFDEGAVQFGAGGGEVSAGGQDQCVTAGGGGQRERTVEALSSGAQVVGQRAGLVEVPEFDECVDVVPDQVRPDGFEDAQLPAAVESRAEFGVRLVGVAAGQGHEATDGPSVGQG